MQQLLAQITNPAVPALQTFGGSGNSGQVGAAILGRYIAVLMVTSISLGGLAVLLYLVMGALQWVTANGDSGKIDKARNRMVQAVVGLIILTSIGAAATFIGPVFGIDILRLEFVNQITGGAASSIRGRSGNATGLPTNSNGPSGSAPLGGSNGPAGSGINLGTNGPKQGN